MQTFNQYLPNLSLLTLLKNKTLHVCLIGGIVFSVLFHFAYSKIEPHNYQARDDGIITMSHAKNWVDYGFIGVAPSGGRVEGYSAPVQFFIYAGLYGLTGIGYEAFANGQTAVFTFLLGALFALFFRESRGYALALSIFAAVILSEQLSFFLWHGSGMENPITHVLFLATVLILYSFARTERIVYPWAVIVFLATISRLDSVYHIAPLLVIFSVFWLVTHKNLRGLVFSILVFGLWVSYHLWRYMYFGDLSPNTATAQGISLSEHLHSVYALSRDHLQYSIGFAKYIASYHGLYLLIPIAPFLYFVRGNKALYLLLLLVGSLAVSSYLNPFFFGPTRLDYSRSTTQLAVGVVLAIMTILYFIQPKKHLLWIVPVFLMTGVFVFKLNQVPKSYSVCCMTADFDNVRKEFTKIAEAESLPRPTVSTPDLGVLSWHKQFNIVDLGWLGTPIMAKMKRQPIAIQSDYFFNYAAPDMMESHWAWSCIHKILIFDNPEFRRLYDPIKESLSQRDNLCNGANLLNGIWIRKDILRDSGTAERILIDDIAADLSANISVVRLHEELTTCQQDPDKNCVYVARTAFRFLPEYRAGGHISALNEVFSQSRTKDYDLYLINGYKDGQAHLLAIDHITERYAEKLLGDADLRNPAIQSDYNVYIQNKKIFYVKESCTEADTKARFFLHLTPENITDLPEGRQKHGFQGLDFDFTQYGLIINGRCIAVRDLPSYKIKQITTGQFIPATGQRVWQGVINLNSIK